LTGDNPAFDDDPPLDKVEAWFQAHPDFADTFGSAIRRAFDEVYDGQRTGRFQISDLDKNEKIYIGTKVEIVVQDAFSLERGGVKGMDYLVAGEQVDCKWSMKLGGWMIPTEAIGKLCLLVWADDYTSKFSIGMVRATDELLGPPNKDKKCRLTQAGQSTIRWLVEEGDLPENLLLHISAEDRDAIFAQKSGQQRVNELFRRVQRRIVRRESLLTVARQLDSPKRARDARIALAKEGIKVLGHQDDDPATAMAMGLPVPRKGEWVSFTEGGSGPTEQ
jgi:hypothetical protein